MKRLFLLLALVVAIPLASGCSAKDVAAIKEALVTVEGQRSAYEEVVASATAGLEAERAKVEMMSDGPERDRALREIARYEAIIETYNKKIATSLDLLATLNKNLESADDWETAVAMALQTASAAIPPPYGLLTSLSAAVLLGIKAARNKAAAKNIAKTVNPFLTEEAKKALKEKGEQTALAKTLIDQSQGKDTPLLSKLPV